MRLSHRLKLFTLLSIAFLAVMTVALLKHQTTQDHTYHKLNSIMSLQLNIDKLQSNLWLLQEYGDHQAIESTFNVQQRIEKELEEISPHDQQQRLLIINLSNMNKTIDTLLTLSQDNLAKSEITGVMSTNGMLIARLNTTIQAMGEDIARLQQIEIRYAEQLQEQLLYLTGITLIIGALSMSLFAFLTMRHFKSSLNVLNQGISELAQGDLHSKVPLKYQDEITQIADQFNEMKQKLKATTISRNALEDEVKSQTQLLITQQEELQYLADHDDLTNTFSRAAFNRYISLAIARCEREEQQACLLFIDLDKFKAINDIHGHSAGDKVLCETAIRLQQVLRKSDVICRQGGDEFVVWLEPCGTVQDVTKLIQKLLEQLSQPVEYEQQPLPISVSIGVSYYPQEGQNLEQLLKIADDNMYMAKSQKGASFYSSLSFINKPKYKQ